MDNDKLKKVLDKAISIEKQSSLGIAKEFNNLEDKIDTVSNSIENIISVVASIDNKEVKTYGNELSLMLESLREIKDSIDSQENIVNIPLDGLSKDILRVEAAIKNIKEVKIPEYPKQITNDNSDIVEAIKSIPEFPIKEINSMVVGLGAKIGELRFEVPEFEYSVIENGIQEIVEAIKKIRIASGGGGPSIVGIKNASDVSINPATVEKQDAQITLETTLISLTETLNELASRLNVLSGMANSGQPALRTIPIASVSTAVTGSLTAVGTLTNFGTGYPAKEAADDINNFTAIIANINNVAIT